MTHPFGDLVDLVIQKVAVAVKVLFLERTASDHLVRKLSLQVHEEFQHLIVRFARKQNTTGVEFVDGAGGAPHIDRVVVGYPQNDFGGAIKSRHQIRRDLVLVDLRRRPKVAQLQHQLGLVHQNVVRFDVCAD